MFNFKSTNLFVSSFCLTKKHICCKYCTVVCYSLHKTIWLIVVRNLIRIKFTLNCFCRLKNSSTWVQLWFNRHFMQFFTFYYFYIVSFNFAEIVVILSKFKWKTLQIAKYCFFSRKEPVRSVLLIIFHVIYPNSVDISIKIG